MNKKADFNFTVALVLILAAGIILILISSGMIQWFKGYFMGESCQASILKASKLRVPVTEAQVLPNLDCPVSKLTITLEDVIGKDKKIEDSKLKRKIADEIYKCWNTIGRDNLDPYSSYEGDEKYCLICSEISFDKSFLEEQQKENYQLKGLAEWMIKNNVTSQKTTYYQVFNGEEPTEQILQEIIKAEENQAINTLYYYSVVWRMDKVGIVESLKMGITSFLLSSGDQYMTTYYFTNQLIGSTSSNVLFVRQDELSKKINSKENQGQYFCTKIVN